MSEVLSKPIILDETGQAIVEALNKTTQAIEDSSKTKTVQSDWNEEDTTSYSYIKNKITNLSQLENDKNFIDNAVQDLLNYYKKTETYTQEEVNNLVSRIPKFSFAVVEQLPTEDISETTIYLLKNTEEEQGNLYSEYIYINDKWELLGSQKIDIDLSKYAKLDERGNIVNDIYLYEDSTDKSTILRSGEMFLHNRYGTTVLSADRIKGNDNNDTVGFELNLTDGLKVMDWDYSDIALYDGHGDKTASLKNLNTSLNDYGLDNELGELNQGYWDGSSGGITSHASSVCTVIKPCKAGDIVNVKYGSVTNAISIIFFNSNGAGRNNIVDYSYSENVDTYKHTAPTNSAFYGITVTAKNNITPSTVGHIGVYVNSSIDEIKADLQAPIKSYKHGQNIEYSRFFDLPTGIYFMATTASNSMTDKPSDLSWSIVTVANSGADERICTINSANSKSYVGYCYGGSSYSWSQK